MRVSGFSKGIGGSGWLWRRTKELRAQGNAADTGADEWLAPGGGASGRERTSGKEDYDMKMSLYPQGPPVGGRYGRPEKGDSYIYIYIS